MRTVVWLTPYSVSFQSQVARAKLTRSGPTRLADFNQYKPREGVSKAIQDKDIDRIGMAIQDPLFKQFAQDAYDSEEGYAIRTNPYTGEKEMFVAGTRNIPQWGLNVLDSALYGGDKLLPGVADKVVNEGVRGFVSKLGPIGEAVAEHAPQISMPRFTVLEHLDTARQSKQSYLSNIAKANGVKVIYGHSRGGAMAADMKVPGAQKVGLDSAMLLAHNTNMLNLNEAGTGGLGSVFDAAIGVTGKANTPYDSNPGKIHWVY